MRLTALSCDWKDRYTTEHLNLALAFVGAGAMFTDVKDTYSDQFVTICASPAVTEAQAQVLFDAGSYYVCDNLEGTMGEIIEQLEMKNENG